VSNICVFYFGKKKDSVSGGYCNLLTVDHPQVTKSVIKENCIFLGYIPSIVL